MNRLLHTKLKQYGREHGINRRRRIISGILAVVVFFGTSYVFINPATTQAAQTYCGFEEHREHEDDCFIETKTLICGLSEEGHVHTDECYEKVLVCGLEEAEGHVHTEECFDIEQYYACGLENTEGHVHTDECFGTEQYYACGLEESEGHVHGDGCYVTEEYYACGLEETEGHIHGEDCYDTEEYLSCGFEETEGHTHGEGCYETEEYLSCGFEETEGHTHGEDCYETDRVLVCADESEDHVHDDSCYEDVETLVCDLEECEPHSHDGSCYSERQVLVCAEEEAPAHIHDETCYSQRQVLVCTEEECEAHVHDESCIGERQVLACELEETEGHIHDESCTGERQVLVCNLEEGEGHTHGEGCAAERQVLICGLEEAEPHCHDDSCVAERQITVCGFEGQEAHHHDESCYELKLVCELQEQEPHVHTDECYEIAKKQVCDLPIHEHTLQCFSNPEADTEDEEIWAERFENVEFSGVWADDVLTAAKTQLNYAESVNNYLVLEDGETMKGYTRYGAWAEDPYADWDALFCAYSMYYAGVDLETVPWAETAALWADALKETDPVLYHEADGDYVPKAGDLVFFDMTAPGTEDEENAQSAEAPKFSEPLENEEDQALADDSDALEGRIADHVAIFAEFIPADDEFDTDRIKTIDGDIGNCVCYNTYDLNGGAVLGYGEIPENPEKPAAVKPAATTIESEPASDGAVAVITGVLPEGAEAVIEAVYLTEEELTAYFGAERAAKMTGYVAYDIKIMVEGEEWQPDETVSVTVRQAELAPETSESFAAAHVDGETNEVSDVDAYIDENGEVTFEAEGFSLYIFYTYTVDFHYGDLCFSIAGYDSILLSELFDELGITEPVGEVLGVTFTDDSLLLIEETEDGDWLLTSLAPFTTDEILTVYFTADRVLEIGVTDAQETPGPATPHYAADYIGTIDSKNQWQIVARQYVDNTTVGTTDVTSKKEIDSDGDGKSDICLQKSVVPTGKENEFLVYLSIDKRMSLESVLDHAFIGISTTGKYQTTPTGTVINNKPEGNASNYLKEHGELGTDGNKPELEYWIHFQVYATSTSTTPIYDYWDTRYGKTSKCSHGVAYFLFPGMTNSFVIADGDVNWHDGQGQGSGDPCLLRLNLDQMNVATGQLYETMLQEVVDEMGDNIHFVELVDGDYTEGQTGTYFDEDERVLHWIPLEKEGSPELAYNPLDGWARNCAQLVYRVELDTTDAEDDYMYAEGGDHYGEDDLPFNSCASKMNSSVDDKESYKVNNSAKLTYKKEALKNRNNSAQYAANVNPKVIEPLEAYFQVPYVRGLLYDLWFRKVANDTAHTPLQGAKFKVKLNNGSYMMDGDEPRIYESDETGIVGLYDLPQSQIDGVVCVEETEAPPFYEMPVDSSWTVPLNYTADKTRFTPDTEFEHPQNMRYTDASGSDDEWEIVNTRGAALPLIIKKVDAFDNSISLAGAQFDLYIESREGQAGAILRTEEDGTEHYVLKVNNEAVLETDDDGMISFDELSLGKYYLFEIKAPSGYVLSAKPIYFELKEDGISGLGEQPASASQDSEGVWILSIKNTAGTELPSTGGVGTAPFVIGGTLMMALAALYLARRRTGSR